MKFPEHLRATLPGYESKKGDQFGLFMIPQGHPMHTLRIIATNGITHEGEDSGWEHVSVSRPDGRLPTWNEMCRVKNLFWDKEETVIQYHPAKENYEDNGPVLHLWRPTKETLPLPPKEFV